MFTGQVEFGDHLALRRALTDQLGPSPPAQHKAQTVQKDRLARTGFAGQHIQPGLKIQLKMIDDQQIADIQRAQPAFALPFRRAGSEPLTTQRLAIDLAQPVIAALPRLETGDVEAAEAFYAEALAQGKLIGWFQGRAELGMRALGGRSILADPRRSDIKDVLNA